MFLLGEAEAVGVAVVQVAMQLHQQQQCAQNHQQLVRREAEPLERWLPPPDGQQRHHHGQRRDLADLHPQVEAQDAQQHRGAVITQRQLLQARGQPEPVQQPEAEDHAEQVRRGHAEVLLEAAVVVEGLVHHAQRDHRVDQEVVPGDAPEGGEDQREAVAQREYGDELRHVPERGQEEHHAEQEQQVVVAAEHVRGAQADILQIAAGEHALAVLGGNAMGEGQHRQRRRGSGEQDARQPASHTQEESDQGKPRGMACRTGPAQSASQRTASPGTTVSADEVAGWSQQPFRVQIGVKGLCIAGLEIHSRQIGQLDGRHQHRHL